MLDNLKSTTKISISELILFSIPIILAILSNNLMLFFDRLILARYSIESMNAVAAIASICTVFQLIGIGIISVSEMLIGRANGNNNYLLISQIVWQMVWFSLTMEIFFIPIALYLGPSLIPTSLYGAGIGYFQKIMLLGSLPILIMSLSIFYTGRGKVIFIIIIIIIGNLLNLGLALILVHGIKGIMSPLGANGAAYATIISQFFQLLILFNDFFKAPNDLIYHTRTTCFKIPILIDCLKLGIINALNHLIDVGTWVLIFYLIANKYNDYLTVYFIGQVIFILFACVTLGIEKAVSIITANLIGSKREKIIPTLLKSAVIFHLIFIIILFFPLIVYPKIIISLFITKNVISKEIVLNLEIAFRWLWFCFIFEGWKWIITGILLAYKDTKFILISKIFSSCILLLVPLYIGTVYLQYNVSILWKILVFYSILHLLILIPRYQNHL